MFEYELARLRPIIMGVIEAAHWGKGPGSVNASNRGATKAGFVQSENRLGCEPHDLPRSVRGPLGNRRSSLGGHPVWGVD